MTKRILLAVTANASLGLMQGLPERLRDEGWDVHIVSSPGPKSDVLATTEGVTFHSIEMARNPSVLSDLRALVRWIRLLREVAPDVTSVGTPKAGLLGGIASFVARVPRRIYVLRGLRYETSTGLARVALKALEQVVCLTAHDVLAVSHSLRDVAIADRLASPDKIVVLGRGSSNGVDVDRFSVSCDERRAAKAERWPDSPDVFTIGFVGRIHPDKGLDLLADAVGILAADGVPGRLVVVGGGDGEQSESLTARLRESGFDVEFTGPVADVARYLRLMDVLCLPTRREGFPNVVLEAAAAGIPTVATTATGIPDAILDNETGLICHQRNPRELANLLQRLLTDASEPARLGKSAHRFVRSEYALTDVQSRLVHFYTSTVNRRAATSETISRSRQDPRRSA